MMGVGMRPESQVWLIADSIRRLQDSWPDDAVSEPVPTPEWVTLVERLIDEWYRGRPWHPAFLAGNIEASMEGVKRSFEAMRQTGFARFTVTMGVELNASLAQILEWPRAHQVPHDIPSIKMLDRQGVPHEQIARMYGLVEPITGRGIIGKVEQELVEPGSVLTEGWVHPLERDRRERRERIEQWLAEFPEATDEKRAAETARVTLSLEEAPEPNPVHSVEEAFVRGLTEVEASELLDLPLSQVMSRYAELQEDPVFEVEDLPELGDDLPNKEDLLREAKDLGVVIRSNISRAKLAEKIRHAKQARVVKGAGDE
jgi:hypothetical protein